jgi:hypothetical protein
MHAARAFHKCQKQHTLSKGTGSQARVRVLRSINLCNPCDPSVETVALCHSIFIESFSTKLEISAIRFMIYANA